MEAVDWLAQLPDLNPIEFFWSYLNNKLGESKNPLAGIIEIWESVEKEWNNIPAFVCQDVIKSCQEVLQLF